MQMPLCFPEKITSGPADIGVIGAMEPGPEWAIGAKGVAKDGGMTPTEEGTETTSRDYYKVGCYECFK